jgi:hypothetical protein
MDPAVMALFAATKSLVPKLPALLKSTTPADFDAKFTAIESEIMGWHPAFVAAEAADPEMAGAIGTAALPILKAIPEKSRELGASKGRTIPGLAASAAGGSRRKRGRKTRRRGGKAARPDFFEPKPKTTRKRNV